MAVLALLLSLCAVAIALTNRSRSAAQAPRASAPQPVPPMGYSLKSDPDDLDEEPSPAAASAAWPAEKTFETGNTSQVAGGGEPMTRITPAPENEQVAAVIAAAIAAYLGDEASQTASAPVTHVTWFGSAGPVWKAAGRESVISSRQSMYGKGYRR